MKSRKTLLLLLIGAAVILTVIWSTRNGSALTRPILLAATTTNSLVIPNVPKAEENVKVSTSKAENNVGTSIEQCPIIPNVKADIDTSDLYPTLNFNVSFTIYNKIWK